MRPTPSPEDRSERARPHTAVLPEAEALQVLVIRAVEEVDRDGRLVPPHLRAAATAGTLGAIEDGEAAERVADAFARRASMLLERVGESLPTLARLTRPGPSSLWLALGAAGVGLVVGLLTDALGADRRINLLSFPLLGILLWNLAIYLLLLLSGLAGRWADRAGGAMRGLVDACVRVWYARVQRSAARATTETNTVLTARCAGRFLELWRQNAGSLVVARVRAALHWGALSLAAGTLVGMYARGLAFEYRATWESTWLDAGQVRVLLQWILAPAAAILGRSLPELGEMSGVEGGAAEWIHLYAVTLALYVGVPRTLLGVYQSWRAQRMAAAIGLDLDDGYFVRLLSSVRGKARRVLILPYSFTPADAVVERIKGALHDGFGARADVRFLASIDYGQPLDGAALEAQVAPEIAGGEDCWVLWFNMAQTPESEVHGGFLEQFKSFVTDREAGLLVMLEASSYRQRIGDEQRLVERAQAWRRVLEDCGIQPWVYDANAGDAEDPLGELRSVVWPSEAGA